MAVGELWDRVRAVPATVDSTVLGPPRTQVLAQVQKILGAGHDWEGVVEMVHSNELNHILNEHGKGHETSPGLIGLEREDVLRIPLVLDSPGSVVHGNQPRTVKLGRKFRDGTLYYVEMYVQPKLLWPSGERKTPPELRTKSMWKEKAESGMPGGPPSTSATLGQ